MGVLLVETANLTIYYWNVLAIRYSHLSILFFFFQFDVCCFIYKIRMWNFTLYGTFPTPNYQTTPLWKSSYHHRTAITLLILQKCTQEHLTEKLIRQKKKKVRNEAITREMEPFPVSREAIITFYVSPLSLYIHTMYLNR